MNGIVVIIRDTIWERLHCLYLQTFIRRWSRNCVLLLKDPTIDTRLPGYFKSLAAPVRGEHDVVCMQRSKDVKQPRQKEPYTTF